MRTSSLYRYLVAFSLSQASWALDNDWSAYPQNSRQCLDVAANTSKCTGSTGQQLNNCLCKNINDFVYNSGDCVAMESPTDLETVYDTMQTNCAGTGVTLSVSKQAFLTHAAVAKASSTVSIAISTAKSTISSVTQSASDSTSSTTLTSVSSLASMTNGSHSLSVSLRIRAVAGILVGTVGGMALIGVGVVFFLRRKKNKQKAMYDSTMPPPAQYQPYVTGNSLGYTQQSIMGEAEMQNLGYLPPQQSYGPVDSKREHHAAEPFLAELGNTLYQGYQPTAPVELPAQGYSDSQHRPQR